MAQNDRASAQWLGSREEVRVQASLCALQLREELLFGCPSLHTEALGVFECVRVQRVKVYNTSDEERTNWSEVLVPCQAIKQIKNMILWDFLQMADLMEGESAEERSEK